MVCKLANRILKIVHNIMSNRFGILVKEPPMHYITLSLHCVWLADKSITATKKDQLAFTA